MNTKKCPKCSVRIEKNGGCDHMCCTICKEDFFWSESKIEPFQIEALRLEGYEQTIGIMDSAIRESCFVQRESTLLTAVRQNTDPSRSASQKRSSSLLRALTHKPMFKGKEKPRRCWRIGFFNMRHACEYVHIHRRLREQQRKKKRKAHSSQPTSTKIVSETCDL